MNLGQEIPPNELQYFKEKVKHWLMIDKQVSDLENQIKDIKKTKKEIMPEITKFMVQYNISDLNTESGKLRCSERKTKSTLSKNYIRIELEKALGDQSEQIDSCMENILNNRVIKTTYVLKKLKNN
jgi:predicted P-loop ATPase|tara:strand:+ start:166 stop:543 length:378 start_codon:yes stop_codon:yes gene_type:complete